MLAASPAVREGEGGDVQISPPKPTTKIGRHEEQVVKSLEDVLSAEVACARDALPVVPRVNCAGASRVTTRVCLSVEPEHHDDLDVVPASPSKVMGGEARAA